MAETYVYVQYSVYPPQFRQMTRVIGGRAGDGLAKTSLTELGRKNAMQGQLTSMMKIIHFRKL
jgi:hypothetical protein